MNSDDDSSVGTKKVQVNSASEFGVRARQKVIGTGLKRLFDAIVDEPVPDEFKDLLAKFDDGDPTARERK